MVTSFADVTLSEVKACGKIRAFISDSLFSSVGQVFWIDRVLLYSKSLS